MVNKKKLSWDEYFMNIAEVVSTKSKDDSTKVGCVIVKDNLIVSTGFNGFTKDTDEDLLTWERPDKYTFVCHAEFNAILNCRLADLKDCILYVNYCPCINCLKTIWQAGIRDIRYKKLYVESCKLHPHDFCCNKDGQIYVQQLKAFTDKLNFVNISNGKTFWEEINQ